MRCAAFAGDDAGDLPAFAALRALVDARRARARGEHRRARPTESPPRGARAPTWSSTARRVWRTLLDALADAISARG